MARLVNTGPGEIADRLTILALKILIGGQSDRPTEHFERERNALLVVFRQTDAAKLVEPLLELAAVNAALWHEEDDLRAYRDHGGDAAALGADGIIAVARIAFRVQALNDQRAKLVADINSRAGETAGQEKLHD